MKVKAAVASTDGKLVNQHFGRADRFYIIQISEESGKAAFLEERLVEPICHGGDYDPDRLKKTVKRLQDCQYLLVSRIGLCADAELKKAGVIVFELPGVIEESVEKMLKYLEVQKLLET